MSTKVGIHSISARIKHKKLAVRMQCTSSVVLSFWLDQYPATAHPLDRINWIAQKWWEDEHAGQVMPAEFAVKNSRYFEACMKEIDAVIAKEACDG